MKLLIKYHADFYPIRAAALSNAASRAANFNVLTSSLEEVSKQEIEDQGRIVRHTEGSEGDVDEFNMLTTDMDAAIERVVALPEFLLPEQDNILKATAFSCVFGGKCHRTESKGIRAATTQTLRRHCQAGVKLGLSEDYQQLVVKKVETVHNHEVSEEVYQHLPRQRRIDPEHLLMAEDMMQLKSNKKLLNIRLQEISGKHVTLRDMTNMSANMRKSSEQNDLVAIVQRLNDIPGK
ncbi:hypothetical protein LSAT2_012337 [Lamellibrachia satsuma]|nr:hypothetical protein LSAT2_012337 [Lamellibrachia satsuma]